LGQPLEVVKTTMAANRGDNFAGALTRIWGRGGVLGCELSFYFCHLQIPEAQFEYALAQLSDNLMLFE
jgi:hypothetical protein